MKTARTLALCFIIIEFLNFQPLSAYIEVYDGCYNNHGCECGDDCGWVIGGNALFWKPQGVEGTVFYSVVPVGEDFQLEREYVNGISDPDFHLGFNLFLQKNIDLCSSSFSLEWVHYGASQEYENFQYTGGDETIEQFIENHPGRFKVNYDRINLRGTRDFLSCRPAVISGFVGLSYLKLHEKRGNAYATIDTTSTLSYYDDHSKLNAGLGEVGVSGKVWILPSKLYVSGELGLLAGLGNQNCSFEGHVCEYTPEFESKVSLSWGRSRIEVTEALFEETMSFSEQSKRSMMGFTGLEYKFEVGFEVEISRVFLKVHAGYAGLYFHDISDHILPSADDELKRTTSSLGFGGPSIGVTASFPF